MMSEEQVRDRARILKEEIERKRMMGRTVDDRLELIIRVEELAQILGDMSILWGVY